MSIRKKSLQFNIIFKQEIQGGFTASVPSLPGCITYGKNLLEAQKMAVDAIEGYIISLRKHGEPIPSDEKSFYSLIEIPQKKAHYA